RPPFLNGMDNGSEVVVKQHDIRCLAGNTGATQPHGDADMGLFQGRRVINAISGDRYPVSFLYQKTYDVHLVLGRHPGEDQILFFQLFTQLLVRHVGAVMPLDDDRLSGYESYVSGDGRSCWTGIAGNHDDLYSGAMTFLEGLRHFRAWRVEQPHETRKGKSLFRDISGRNCIKLPECQSYNPKPLGGHGLLLRKELGGTLAVYRDNRAGLTQRGAERHHAFASPFDQSEQLPVDPVESGHPFPVRIEGGFAQLFTVPR